jgi:F-type H+-transporting ATPase subunit b
MKGKSLITVMFVLLWATVAVASSGGGGNTSTPGELLLSKGFFFQLLNFAILVTALFFIGRKPLREMFVGRTKEIADGIEEARVAREGAQEALKEVQARFDAKDAEIKKMIEAGRVAGEQEKERLVSEGERMSAKLIEQARTGIELEMKQASDTLRAEAAALALELAEQKIKSEMSDSEQKVLFEEALGKLEDRS